MIQFVHPVSHEWRRRQILQQWHKGHLPQEEICDADFLLRTAANFHGHPSNRPCPICAGANLHEVYWVYGEIGRAAGSARSLNEIEQLLTQLHRHECEVHIVEVCPDCHWNFLRSTAIAQKT